MITYRDLDRFERYTRQLLDEADIENLEELEDAEKKLELSLSYVIEEYVESRWGL